MQGRFHELVACPCSSDRSRVSGPWSPTCLMRAPRTPGDHMAAAATGCSLLRGRSWGGDTPAGGISRLSLSHLRRLRCTLAAARLAMGYKSGTGGGVRGYKLRRPHNLKRHILMYGQLHNFSNARLILKIDYICRTAALLCQGPKQAGLPNTGLSVNAACQRLVVSSPLELANPRFLIKSEETSPSFHETRLHLKLDKHHPSRGH